MKILKNIAIILFVTILSFGYSKFKVQSFDSNANQFSILLGYIMQAPITIPYLLVTIMGLFYLGKLPFFKGVQMSDRPFVDKRKKSTGKEILATIVFGIITFSLMIGFAVIIDKLVLQY